MNSTDRVAVCSRSFSRNPTLRSALLERYKNVKFNDSGKQLEGAELVKFLKGSEKAITALEKITDDVLSQLPELKVIGKYGVGIDMIDIDAMRRHGKRLGWVKGVNRRSVSEMVVSLAISMLRYFPSANKEVVSGGWKSYVGRLLSGSVVGIIGCGYIGKDLIQLLKPWGCRFLVFDIIHDPSFYDLYDVTPVNLSELLRNSDIVTVHVPLDASTRNMLSAEKLHLMKPSAILINAARGGLVDEIELKAMLTSGQLMAAAFDVFQEEPPKDVELLRLPNFFATPHIGGSAEEAILAMGYAAIDSLDINEIPIEI